MCSVAKSCLTLCDSTGCSPPGPSVHGILQARTLEWVAMHCSRGSSWPRDRTLSPALAGGFFTMNQQGSLGLIIQFSRLVVSDSLGPHGLQHARPPCLSPTPGVYSNSCPLSPWYHPTILCHPLLLSPSAFPSMRVFSNESALRIKWPKYWSFSFNNSPSSEHSGLISFRMHWLDLLAVQGTLKSPDSSYSRGLIVVTPKLKHIQPVLF